MARDLQLELVHAGGTFTFDLRGNIDRIAQAREYKLAANPPELSTVIETWRITDAVIVGDTTDALWDRFDALEAILSPDRTTGTPVTSVRIVRDPSGDAEVERVLSAPTYNVLNIQNVEYGPVEEEPLRPGVWRSHVACAFDVEARRYFADGNGIVNWNQIVRVASEGGLQTVEWETEITTKEGVSALDAARTYAKIPIADYGTTYLYDTDNDDGIDYDILDADEPNDRIPTHVRAFSRIRQYGENFGTVASGQSPSRAEFSVETLEEGQEKVTVYRAAAEGPGALNYVKGKRPANPTKTRLFEERVAAPLRVEGEWEVRRQIQVTSGVVWTVRARLSGGQQTRIHRVTSGLQPPVLQHGPLLPYRLEVDVTVTLRSTSLPSRLDMPFPQILGTPWVFLADQSEEDALPALTENGRTPEGNQYERRARAVYEAAEGVTAASMTPLFDTNRVALTYKGVS